MALGNDGCDCRGFGFVASAGLYSHKWYMRQRAALLALHCVRSISLSLLSPRQYVLIRSHVFVASQPEVEGQQVKDSKGHNYADSESETSWDKEEHQRQA